MEYIVYIIYSAQIDRFYVGHTQDLKDRLFRHNNSGSKSTKKANDWKLVYSQSFTSRADAMKREMEIKKKKSRNYILQLIETSAG